MSISPVNPTVEKGSGRRLVALAYDKNGNFVELTPSWTLYDTIGIINNNGQFYAPQGLAGPFPMTATVIATYQDLRAIMSINITLGIYSIYSDIYPHDFVYDRNNPPTEHGGWLLISGNTNFGALSDDNFDFPPTATEKSLVIKLMPGSPSYIGGYWMFGKKAPYTKAFEDLSQYGNAGAYLHFYIKPSYGTNVEVKIESQSGTNSIYLKNKNYGQGGKLIIMENIWQKAIIPLSDFASVDYSTVTIPVSFYPKGITAGQYIKVGEILYSPSKDYPN